jgi:hypothetical protein
MEKYKLKRKSEYRRSFKGSDRMFNACWKRYREFLNGSIDDPQSDTDVDEWLDSIASEKVNNSRSSFYITG